MFSTIAFNCLIIPQTFYWQNVRQQINNAQPIIHNLDVCWLFSSKEKRIQDGRSSTNSAIIISDENKELVQSYDIHKSCSCQEKQFISSMMYQSSCKCISTKQFFIKWCFTSCLSPPNWSKIMMFQKHDWAQNPQKLWEIFGKYAQKLSANTFSMKSSNNFQLAIVQNGQCNFQNLGNIKIKISLIHLYHVRQNFKNTSAGSNLSWVKVGP